MEYSRTGWHNATWTYADAGDGQNMAILPIERVAGSKDRPAEHSTQKNYASSRPFAPVALDRRCQRILLAVLADIEVGVAEDAGVRHQPAVWFGCLTAAQRKACSRAVRSLEEAGLLVRITEPNRDRVTHVQLTPAGLWRALQLAGPDADCDAIIDALLHTTWGQDVLDGMTPANHGEEVDSIDEMPHSAENGQLPTVSNATVICDPKHLLPATPVPKGSYGPFFGAGSEMTETGGGRPQLPLSASGKSPAFGPRIAAGTLAGVIRPIGTQAAVFGPRKRRENRAERR